MCVPLNLFFYFKKRNLYLYEAFSTSLCPMFHKPPVLRSASLCAHHSTRGFWFYRYFPILPFVFNYRLVVILRDRCEFSPLKPCLFSGLECYRLQRCQRLKGTAPSYRPALHYTLAQILIQFQNFKARTLSLARASGEISVYYMWFEFPVLSWLFIFAWFR